jgi:flavin reductase (DIM6/NTAB) family NADH-FMN oxidoreductase RutF
MIKESLANHECSVIIWMMATTYAFILAEVVAYEKNTQFKSIARFGNKYYTLIPL